MTMVTMNVKPMSVNEAWRGRRTKTDKYKGFEKLLLFTLPKKVKIPVAPLEIHFEFGFSSIASDWDNPVKPIQDILQKKYNFDDKHVYRAVVEKKIVPKGEEYFKFEILRYEQGKVN